MIETELDVDIGDDGFLYGRGNKTVKKKESKRGRAVSVRRLKRNEKLSDISIRASIIDCLIEGKRSLGFYNLKKRIRYRDASDLVVFLLDASGSMELKQRLAFARGAAFSILRRAYIYRCRVAVVSFCGDSADVVMQPSVSLLRAKQSLKNIRVGDATPLPAGLIKARDLIRRERYKSLAEKATLVLISDGQSNVPLRSGANSFTESCELLSSIASEEVKLVLVDAGDGNEMKRLSSCCNAYYHRLPTGFSSNLFIDILPEF